MRATPGVTMSRNVLASRRIQSTRNSNSHPPAVRGKAVPMRPRELVCSTTQRT